MAAPTAPTLVTITTEGCKLAGYTTPSSALLTRAQDEWMKAIKNDIWTREKKLKPLLTTAVMITTAGISRYAMPTDFGSELSMRLFDGNTTGTAQDGASGSITLAAADTTTQATMQQNYGILVYAGTGKGSYSEVSSYNSSTNVATVSPNFNVAPVTGDSYMHVDKITPLHEMTDIAYNNKYIINGSGTPEYYNSTGDVDNGEVVIYPKPYRDSGIPWGIEFRYYADLMRVDLASTLMTTLYRRWYSLFVLGVQAKALEDKDDTRANAKLNEYYQNLRQLVVSEIAEYDASNMQVTL